MNILQPPEEPKVVWNDCLHLFKIQLNEHSARNAVNVRGDPKSRIFFRNN